MNAITPEVESRPVHKNVFSAVAAAQLEFGAVQKGSVNPAFKSRYADLADVAAVVIPTLARHGVAVLHYLTGDSLDRMRTEFVHGETETRVFCDVPLIVDRQNMQGMKSATTYAKRIGLESLSGVAPDDDDGNGAVSSAPRASASPRTSQPSDRPKSADMSGEADRMIGFLKEKGVKLTAHPKFVEDLKKLRAADARSAARVDHAIEELRAARNSDLDDEIPY